MSVITPTTNANDNLLLNDLNEYVDSLDLDHPDAHIALATILLSWTSNNDVSRNLLGYALTQIAFDQTFEDILEDAVEYLQVLASIDDSLLEDCVRIGEVYEFELDSGYEDLDLNIQIEENIQNSPAPSLRDQAVTFAKDIHLNSTVGLHSQSILASNDKSNITDSLLNTARVHDALEDGTPIPSAQVPTINVLVDASEEDLGPVPDGMIRVWVQDSESEQPIEEEPAKEQSVTSEYIEDLAMAKGIAVLSADDWKKSNFSRNTPVIIRNFDFKAISRPDLGKASHMLIGTKNSQDVRIELRSQTVSGSAGDKLPVLIHKLDSLQQSREYGQTVVGIVGDTSLYSKYSLDLARKVAASSGLVMYAEGDSPVKNVLDTVFDNVLSKFDLTPKVEPDSTNKVDTFGI